MSLLQRIRTRIRQLRCQHKWHWSHNYHGDEVIRLSGGMRSAWRCVKCHDWQYRETVGPEKRPVQLRFRKRPIVIEAFQMTEARRRNNEDWPSWLHQAWNMDPTARGSVCPQEWPESDGSDKLVVNTLEGLMLVEWNDWIIRGVHGELYPCKPDIFAKTYEPV